MRILFHALLHLTAIAFVCLVPPADKAPKFADFPPRHGEQTMYIMRVIDGDTVEAAFLTTTHIRIHGINARELKEAGGPEARKALELMLPPGSLQQADLRGLDKYGGRQLADFKTSSGTWVSLELIGSGHARPWDGQGKKP